MNPGARVSFGVDLGGTKIEAAVLGADGAVLARRRIATPAGDYDGTIRAVAGLVKALEGEVGARAWGVGLGLPGSLSPRTGLLRNANSTVLNGRPVDRDLSEVLGRPVRATNDANCFALAEAVAGAGQGAGTVFGVILGTGVGAGVMIDGAVHDGAGGIAGEWGHVPLPEPRPDETPGPDCWCGRRGCIETWLSGPGLAADHARHGGVGDAKVIAAAAAAGEAGAAETLSRHRERLGRALAMVVNILDPAVIVLGGGLSNLDGLADALPALIAPHVFSDSFETPVRRNVLGDSAGVIGAAWLAPIGSDAGESR